MSGDPAAAKLASAGAAPAGIALGRHTIVVGGMTVGRPAAAARAEPDVSPSPSPIEPSAWNAALFWCWCAAIVLLDTSDSGVRVTSSSS